MGARPFWTRIHRYAGLAMACFLLVAGLTGSLLAWNDELEALLSPALFLADAPTPRAPRLSPLLLRERVQARYPWATVSVVPLAQAEGKAVVFQLPPSSDPVTMAKAPPADVRSDQAFVNPYTGDVQGERRWGDLSQGARNLMPFVYRLHYSLALGDTGDLLFGIVALLWTLDCFVGACLTFPPRARQRKGPGTGNRKPWLRRWWPAWTLRWRQGSTYKWNVDLHRAGGLWVWGMLLVLAWSSVAFNLRPVYNPVMKSLFAYQRDDDAFALLPMPQPLPAIGWNEALATARRLMAEQARARGIDIHAEDRLSYDADRAIYRYDVLSGRDIRDHGGTTMLMFDANTGVFKGLWLPTGQASGDTIRMWLTSMHMAKLWGLPFKAFISVMGLIVAMLSVTGVYIWWKKRRARLKSHLRPRRMA